MDEEEKADVRSEAPPKEDETMTVTSHDASEEGKQMLAVPAAPSLSSFVSANSLLLPLADPTPAPLPLFFSDPQEASLDHDFDDDFDVDLAVAATDAAVAAAASAAAAVADTTSLQPLPVELPSVRSPVQAQQVQSPREQLDNGMQQQQQLQQIAAEPLHDAPFATAASLFSALAPASTTEQDASAAAIASAVAETAAPVVCFACRQAEWPGAPLLGCLACGNRFHNWEQCRGGGSNDLCSECASAGMDDDDADGEDHPLAAGGGGGSGSKFYATLAHRPPTGGSNGSGAAHARQAQQQHQDDDEDRPLRHTMLARSIHEAVRLSQHAAAPQQTETIDLTDD
jgi:hypothetical protein